MSFTQIREILLLLLRKLGYINWIPFGIKDRIIRFFVNPDLQQSQEFEVDFFGKIYRGNLNTFIDWSVYFYGAYNRQELFLLKKLICETSLDPVFVDIGANVGHHAIFMSNYGKKVFAFEPYDNVRNKLEQKIQQNKIVNIEVIPYGLGVENCESDFYAPKEGNTGTGSFIKSHAIDNNKLYKKLKIINGDSYFNENRISKLDLIKIDVEGYEKFVLKGLQKTICSFRPIILMEFSETTMHSFESLDELRQCLPINYEIKGVRFFQNSYRISSFKFGKPTDTILLLPTEKAPQRD